jgi:hypothetical protein
MESARRKIKTIARKNVAPAQIIGGMHRNQWEPEQNFRKNYSALRNMISGFHELGKLLSNETE